MNKAELLRLIDAAVEHYVDGFTTVDECFGQISVISMRWYQENSPSECELEQARR